MIAGSRNHFISFHLSSQRLRQRQPIRVTDFVGITDAGTAGLISGYILLRDGFESLDSACEP